MGTLPLAATLVLVSPRSAALSEKIGAAKVMSTGFGFIAAGLAVLTQVDTSSSYLVIAGALILLGIGMGITVAPATGSIMAAVPMNKAGVGSAVNDTTREVGGALGIAVLGSIANSAYRSDIGGDALAKLPPDAAAAARDSIGAAGEVAKAVPGDGAATLLAEAKDAFVTAFHTSLGAAAIIAAVIGVGVFVAGRRAVDPVNDATEDESEGTATPVESVEV